MRDTLAFDLGGSSFRLAVVTERREIKHMIRIPLRIAENENGEFEADPAYWWQVFQEACQQLADKEYKLTSISAIVGCGFTRTQVPIDKDGNVVHPAITFQDSRGAKALSKYLGKVSAGAAAKVKNLNPYHPIARLLWLKEKKPEIWRKVDKVIEPKDYLNLQLTGVVCSDRISQGPLSSFFDALKDDNPALEVAGISPSICPDQTSPFTDIGVVQNGLPAPLNDLAGIPVVCGSPDTWTCVLGSGGLNPGAAYSISGTSDVFGIITEKQAVCDGLISIQWGPNQWQLGGPSQGAASRLQWAADRFYDAQPIKDVIHNAFECRQNPPIFLPYLDGERTPFWDADLRGAFVGVSVSHEARDFVRAVADGINFLSRMILERAEQAAGIEVGHVCFSGGLANNPNLCQLKADILNRAIFVPEAKESGLIGSASMAFTDSGDIGDITASIMTKGNWFAPDSKKQAFYNERFEVFQKATAALEGISHQLTRSTNTLLPTN